MLICIHQTHITYTCNHHKTNNINFKRTQTQIHTHTFQKNTEYTIFAGLVKQENTEREFRKHF